MIAPARADSGANFDAEAVKEAVIPHVATLFEHWGGRLSGNKTSRGWIECHAIDRPDERPSAAINDESGVYHDLTTGTSHSLFSLAVEMGAYDDVRTAIARLGEQFLGGSSPDPDSARATMTRPATAHPAPRPAKKLPQSYPSVESAVQAIRRGRAATLWHYGDALKILRVETTNGKTFRPIHRKVDGQWYCGDPEGLLPLYGLNTLASATGGPIVVCEGEKAADAAAGLGFVATTSSHGSKSAAKSDWSPLAGRNVVIIPDHDEPGRAYADEVARILLGIDPATKVRIVELPGQEEGDDIVEWVQRGGTAEQLAELIAEAPYLQAEPELSDEDLDYLEADHDKFKAEMRTRSAVSQALPISGREHLKLPVGMIVQCHDRLGAEPNYGKVVEDLGNTAVIDFLKGQRRVTIDKANLRNQDGGPLGEDSPQEEQSVDEAALLARAYELIEGGWESFIGNDSIFRDLARVDGSATETLIRSKVRDAKRRGFSLGDYERRLKAARAVLKAERKKGRRKVRGRAASLGAVAVAGAADYLPRIEIDTQRDRAVEETIAALGRDPELYVRGDRLVQVVREEGDSDRLSARTRLNGVNGSPRILPLSDPNVGCLLTRNMGFFTSHTSDGEQIISDVHPPDWLIKAVATRKHYPNLRPLESVAECPFPRPDGSIVEAPGYDVPTATLYLPTEEFPDLPESPTRDDAREAWARIGGYFRQFPLASEPDLSVVLAGMLTVIARPAIVGPVPGVAVIGNKAGTGKGLLIDCMVMPGIGRPCPTSNYPDDKAEAVKVKVGLALSAARAVHFDNVESGTTYGSGPVDGAMTSTITSDRVLGTNDAPVLSLRPCWFLSGNNLSPAHDAHRRWLVCNLATELDRPEERTDLVESNLRAVILRDRAAIVRDALTILKSHSSAGYPRGPSWGTLGSFEDWDRVVRGAVWFATGMDCLASQRAAAKSAPDHLRKLALIEGWRELGPNAFGPGARGVTAAEAVKVCERFDAETSHPGLHAALMGYGSNGKIALPRVLGAVLKGLRNCPLDGHKFEIAGEIHKTTLWRVVECTPPTPEKPIREESGVGIRGSGGSVSKPPRDQTEKNEIHNVKGNFIFSHVAHIGPETDPPDPLIPTRVETPKAADPVITEADDRPEPSPLPDPAFARRRAALEALRPGPGDAWEPPDSGLYEMPVGPDLAI